MPTIDYEARLVFDEDFYEKVIKEDPSLLTKLMYINANFKGHKRTANVMSKKIFNKILSNNPSMLKSLLRSSFYDMEVEELEEISDEIERIIKYAIHILEEPPHRSIILTSDNKIGEYERNPHNNVIEVSVKCGNDAKELIEEYWKEYKDRKS